MSGTLSPSPWFTGLDNAGNIIPGGKLFTYEAGTTTKIATFTDVDLSVPNTNPIILDAAGRATIYLNPGTSYKFVLSPASDTDPPTAPIRTQDNIGAVPASASNQDTLGVAGEDILAGEVCYLSDGSDSKNAGQWYLALSTRGYASATPQVAMATTTLATGETGVFRSGGALDALSGLTAGETYYVGAVAGTLTTTPTGFIRRVGQAVTTTSLEIASNPPVSVDRPTGACGRLTLESGVPVSVTDQTAKTEVFWTPYLGDLVPLFTGNGWVDYRSPEIDISVPATTATLYDVFFDYNDGAPQLALTAWTNDTTRATALISQDGLLVKTGDTQQLYLGSFRTTGVSGQTEDSVTKRYVWNYYNRVRRSVRRIETTASWTYATATIRQANASTANQVEVVVGVAESLLSARVWVQHINSAGVNRVRVGFGEDSTTTFMTQVGGEAQSVATNTLDANAQIAHYPAIGRHFYSWNEVVTASGTTTFFSNGGAAYSANGAGIIGSVDG